MSSAQAKPLTKRIPRICYALIAVLIVYTGAHALLIHYSSSASLAAPIIVCAVFSISILASYLLRSQHKQEKKGIDFAELPFLFCLLTSGIAFAVVMAPGTVPDEEYHYISSYCYANGFNVTRETGEDGEGYLSVQARKTDSDFYDQSISETELNSNKYSIGMDAIGAKADFEPATMVTKHTSAKNVTSNPIPVRFASAAGISLGRLLGLNGEVTFYLGRLFNFLFFAALIIAAVKTAPIGKPVFETLALLPMTLHLAASYSYDAPLIGYSFLFTALSLKLIKGKGSIPPADLVLYAVLALCLGTCKGVYALLFVLVFFIPASRYPSKRASVIYRALIVALPVFAFILLRLDTLLGMLGLTGAGDANSTDITGVSEFQSIQLMDLVAHPLTALLILVKTLHSQLAFYIDTFLGGSLGWFQPNLKAPAFFTAGYAVILYLGSVHGIKDEDCFGTKTRIVAIAVLIVSALAVLYSLMTGWAITDYIILGVQGRYFLPFAPFGIILIRKGMLRFNKEVATKSLIVAEQTMNGIYLIYILTCVLLAG